MVALFADQSRNIMRITPVNAIFRLIRPDPPGGPFINQATEMLDYLAGEVQIAGNPNYSTFSRVRFHH